MELALPLLMAAMVLVAAGFTMRMSALAAPGDGAVRLLAGFGFYFLRNFAQALGDAGRSRCSWPPGARRSPR